MNIQEAKAYVKDRFPFPNYMDGAVDLYETLPNTVNKYLKPGDKILDFGSGPCDKLAILQVLGYECTGYDDLSDEWHLLEDNREKIFEFTKDIGIRFVLADDESLPFDREEDLFDMIMSHDVIEHLHNSPRELFNELVALIKTDGYIFLTVPNAANLRKRLAVMFGQTNHPPYETYYWYPDPWRGHVREYVKDDLRKLSEYLGLEIVELRSSHHMLKVLPPLLRKPFVFLTHFFPGWRDSWLLVAKKPKGWVPKKELSKEEYLDVMGKLRNPYEHS